MVSGLGGVCTAARTVHSPRKMLVEGAARWHGSARPRCWTLLVALAIACSGCVGYVPARPRVGIASGALVRVERMVRMVDATELHLRIAQVQPQTRLLAAVLARPGSEPCRFGWAATRVAVSAAPGQLDASEQPELRSGAQLFLFFSPEVGSRIAGGARLDLVTSREGHEDCIAIPITSAAPEHSWRRESSVSMDLALGGSYFHGSPGGVIGDFPITLAVGRSFGDVRLYGGGGIGIAICSENTCPVEVRDKGTENERTVKGLGLAVPLFVGLETLPWQVGYFAFGAVLEYGTEYVRLETYESTREEWLHAPMAAPRLALTYPDPIAPGIRGGPSNGFIALDVPLGVVYAPGPDSRFAPRIGVRLVASMLAW